MTCCARACIVSAALFVGVVVLVAAPQAPEAPVDGLHRPFEQLLDIYVRDGLVYYRALKSDRAKLDRYVASLNVPTATYDGWPREQKMAFWVNAYNAFVLQTVIDAYPIRGKSDQYPAESIRQVPGAFEKIRHRAAGRTVTLDDIEKTILPEFKEPRLYLALGRGAVGGGRLRSEAFTAARLGAQLDAIQAESVTNKEIVRVDRASGQVSVSPIFGWREAEFAAAYDKTATGPLAERAPIERAIVAFITPHLLPLEREFLRKSDFRVAYHTFDWRLNDLTGGRTR